MTAPELHGALEVYYEAMDGNERVKAYHEAHGTQSAGILTCYDDEYCALLADFLEDRVKGKVVVEIGAGIGLLACHVAQFARRVYAIEVDPGWAGIFATQLWERKPKNLTFIFGTADEAPPICADVAFFCTYSGRPAMYQAATRFAPLVIDVYAELHKDDPKYKEREWAMQNRENVDMERLITESAANEARVRMGAK
jgi:hypothetical protein